MEPDRWFSASARRSASAVSGRPVAVETTVRVSGVIVAVASWSATVPADSRSSSPPPSAPPQVIAVSSPKPDPTAISAATPSACSTLVAARDDATTQGDTASGSGVQVGGRSEEHTSELQSHLNLVCRLLLEKKK